MFAIIRQIIRRLPWVLLTTLVAGLIFTWVQVIFDDWGDIGTWIGMKIVKAGEYPVRFHGPIGWTTHMAISFSYAMLVAVVVSTPLFPSAIVSRWISYLATALVLGWVTTLITSPAIDVTVSMLAGQGFPSEISGLNFQVATALWNHLLFFVIAFVLVGIIPECLAKVGKGSN